MTSGEINFKINKGEHSNTLDGILINSFIFLKQFKQK